MKSKKHDRAGRKTKAFLYPNVAGSNCAIQLPFEEYLILCTQFSSFPVGHMVTAISLVQHVVPRPRWGLSH